MSLHANSEWLSQTSMPQGAAVVLARMYCSEDPL
jgi:hypothetical protein